MNENITADEIRRAIASNPVVPALFSKITPEVVAAKIACLPAEAQAGIRRDLLTPGKVRRTLRITPRRTKR